MSTVSAVRTDQDGFGGGTTTVFTLSGAAAMSNSSVTSCQGGVFTIPVTLTATS